jgi:hypothetical protein
VKTKESLYFFPAFYAMKLELVPLKPYNRLAEHSFLWS